MEQVKHAVSIYPYRPAGGRRVRFVAHGMGELANWRRGHRLGRRLAIAGALCCCCGALPAPLACYPLGNVDAGFGGVARLAGIDRGGRTSSCWVLLFDIGAALSFVRWVTTGRGLGLCGSGVALLGRGVAGLVLDDLVLIHLDVDRGLGVVALSLPAVRRQRVVRGHVGRAIGWQVRAAEPNALMVKKRTGSMGKELIIVGLLAAHALNDFDTTGGSR